METAAFDRFTRSLSAYRNRRLALIAVVGGALGAPLLSLDTADAKKKKPCPPCKKRKKGKCKADLPDGTACESGTCQAGQCVASPVPPPPPPPAVKCGAGVPCKVFVSSSVHTAALGGLGGADTICQNLAAAAGLSGAFKAWLSDDSSEVLTRFATSTGPYQLVNGTTIATSFADLTDGTLLAPIGMTEAGGAFGGSSDVWTGTLANGKHFGANFTYCANWNGSFFDTGPAGLATSMTSTWTQAAGPACDGSVAHLYCFQQA